VSEGSRTLNPWSHSPVLYQLSYTHHGSADAGSAPTDEPGPRGASVGTTKQKAGGKSRRARRAAPGARRARVVAIVGCVTGASSRQARHRTVPGAGADRPTAGVPNDASAPGGTRTPDPQLRRLLLYPPELLAPVEMLARRLRLHVGKWSGRADSNGRPPAPKAGALTRLRYAPDVPRLGPVTKGGGEINARRRSRRAGNRAASGAGARRRPRGD
jgi:hypothetical protein